jgi:hypothetical protein
VYVVLLSMDFLTCELANSCDFLVTVDRTGRRVEANPRYWNSDCLNKVEKTPVRSSPKSILEVLISVD